MKVIRARAMGMCFGVRDALQAAHAVPDPDRTTIYGELVHNPQVLGALAARGFASLPEDGRAIPDSPRVLVTAHGVSGRERSRLLAAGKELVDTTCPLVRRAHDAAQSLQRQGYFVVVIGRASHVEVLGITGDLERFAVVSKPQDAVRYDTDRIGVICQTTTPPPEAEGIRAAIRTANPEADIRHIDTICRPTRERQEAALELLGLVDAVVVVGGRHSNNTRQLVVLAESRNVPVAHVESATELDRRWLAAYGTVGLTAGTSTLDSTIDDVERALEAI